MIVCKVVNPCLSIWNPGLPVWPSLPGCVAGMTAHKPLAVLCRGVVYMLTAAQDCSQKDTHARCQMVLQDPMLIATLRWSAPC